MRRDALLDRDDITRLFRLRREAIHFQHVLARMSDVCGKLTNLDVPHRRCRQLLEQQRQGINTRQLAAWAAILGVPVPNVAEPRAPHGYALVIGAMMAICLGLYIRFKKLRWL